MTRTVAMLLAVTLAACGSASSAGPKTSNPPLKPDKEAKAPAKKPAVEVDGLNVKFNIFGFSLTLPNEKWGGKAEQAGDGNIYIIFQRKDSAMLLLMLPVGIPGQTTKAIAESQLAVFSADAANTVGPLEEESGGRWRFTLESKATDGTVSKGRMSVQPLPGGKPDRYLLAMIMAPSAEYDQLSGEAMSLLDSLKALP